MREWPVGLLKEEGQDGRAEGRVVAELLQVAAVLPLGPHSHLDEAHQGEEGYRQALGHQGEAQPGAQLQEEEEGCYTQTPTTRGQQIQLHTQQHVTSSLSMHAGNRLQQTPATPSAFKAAKTVNR